MEKIARAVIISIGGLGSLWFMLPFVWNRILNIGNLTGIAVCFLLFFYGINIYSIHKWIKKIWEKRSGRVVLSVLAVGGIAICFTTLSLSVCMLQAAYKHPKTETTVVVLGCRVYGERASLMLVERLDAAYDFLQANEDIKCIVSGGQGNGENISEAECMYRYLVKKGIAEERIFKESKSVSTKENIAFSKQIIKENNLKEDITIITNEFHQYRAGKIAQKEGITVSSVSGKTAWWLFPTFYVRELYGILYELFLEP